MFDESQYAPNGTAPEDAYVPPGDTLEAKASFCRLNMHDPAVGLKCVAWLREKGLIQ